MAQDFITQIHFGTYKGELVGIYKYSDTEFSLPFTGQDSAYLELLQHGVSIEKKFIDAKTRNSNLPETRNEKQRNIERSLRKEYL